MRQAKLDEQKRAVEIIIASFVLTFFNEATIDKDKKPNTHSIFVNEKNKLEKLVERQHKGFKPINFVSAWTRRKW